jgi:hypothetical protein
MWQSLRTRGHSRRIFVVRGLGDGGDVDRVVELGFPFGFNRCRTFGPEAVSIGAVALYRA